MPHMRLFEGAGLWRGRRSRAAPALSIAALMVLLSTAFTIGSGRDLDRVNLTSGGAWLASPQRGFVTLIDGPSEQIVATVAAAPASTGVSVTQAGTSAFISDNTLGTVARIDGATYEISPAVRFGSAGSQLSVVAGRNAAFVVDATARVATVANATDLTVVRTVSLGARPGNQQTLADDSGRLWAVDSENGGLSWFDSNGDRDQTGADPAARLIEVAGRAAIAEFGESGQGFAWLTPDGGRDSWKCQLPMRAGDQLQLLGSAEAEHAFVVVSETGTVILADSSGELCGTAMKIADPGADLGPPVQSGRFVLVPVRSKGTTAVIDTASATLVADLPLTVAGNDLELLNKDGIVFYNDLDSERAGVLKLDAAGKWSAGISLKKYDPETGAAQEIVDPTFTDRQVSQTAGGTDVSGELSSSAGATIESSNETRSSTSQELTATTTPNPTRLSPIPPSATKTLPSPAPGQSTSESESTSSLVVHISGEGKVTGPGINCPEDCSDVYSSNQDLVINAVEAPGSTFKGWGGACTGNDTECRLTMSATRDVTAEFVSTKVAMIFEILGSGEVTLRHSGESIPCAAPECSVLLSEGETITIEVDPAAGFELSGWTKTDCLVVEYSCEIVVGTDDSRQTIVLNPCLFSPPSRKLLI